MSRVYCAFCYVDWEDKKLTAQEILTNEKVDKKFVTGGLNTAARAAAYELAVKYTSYATRGGTDKIAYRYGFFSFELGDVRQEKVTITKEFERGDAML